MTVAEFLRNLIALAVFVLSVVLWFALLGQ